MSGSTRDTSAAPTSNSRVRHIVLKYLQETINKQWHVHQWVMSVASFVELGRMFQS